MKFTKMLDIKAKDNHGNEYPVSVDLEPLAYSDTFDGRDKRVLNINGTPGTWYLTTLRSRGGVGEKLSIHGNDWICVNIQEVMEAVPR